MSALSYATQASFVLGALLIAATGLAVAYVGVHVLLVLWRTRGEVIAHRCRQRLNSGRECRMELSPASDAGDDIARCSRGHAWRVTARWCGDLVRRYPAADVRVTIAQTNEQRRQGAS